MTTQENLIAALKAAFPEDSQAALARRAGLSVQRFNNYVTGIRTMDVDAVIGCAQALGWDIRETVANHELETAPTPRVKAYWRKLATTAALLAVVAFPALPDHADAATHDVSAAQTRHYAKWLVGLLWSLLAWKLRPGKPSPGNMEAKLCA